MQNDLLVPSPCAICEAHTNAEILYTANFDAAHLNAEVFSARRLPDRIHYQMVRCQTCGLVRSDPIAQPELIAKLYHASAFTYTAEIESLKTTYGRCLAQVGTGGGALLEVGCGNGFFLEVAQQMGYADVWGVEPSADAVAKAPPAVTGRIKQDIFRAGLFAAEQFDTVCFFQVLDHFPDPNAVLAETLRILKPGGKVLAVNHDVLALQVRLLGRRSPIIDIEHTYLYSKATQRRLFEKHGFAVLDSFDVTNKYPLHYWMQLFPLPTGLKKALIWLAKTLQIGKLPLALKVGNQGLIAQKP